MKKIIGGLGVLFFEWFNCCLTCGVFFLSGFSSPAFASTFSASPNVETGRITFTVNCTADAYCLLKEGSTIIIGFDYYDSYNATYFIKKEPNTYTFKLESYSQGNYGLSLTETDVVTVTLAAPPPASGDLVTNFSYDALGRLRVVENVGESAESLRYDRAGNRCEVSAGVDADEGYCDE